ncbi:MAG: IS21 family transposase, partial [Propionibacteriaceae bacterium]|jgi:transposase|nr:IS21 family transposase [Propionibacteriaceae bacterium]
MVDYGRIVRLAGEGVSQRGIADVLGCSRNTVAGVFAAVRAAGIGWEEAAGLGVDGVRRLVLGEPAGSGHQPGRVVPDFERVHRELGRPNVTLLLLWNEYADQCRASGGAPYQYSFFNEQYRRWVKSTGAVLRMVRTPGESVEVDWAGDPMGFIDPLTGVVCRAWLFVAAWSYSAYSYVEGFPDMGLGSWVEGHVHAFEAFGGAARLLIPDNLRTGVARSDRYEPALNPAYARLAEHYGTVVVPARVKRPRDKPVVEGSVRFVANQVAATLRDRQFIGLPELNEAVAAEVGRINAKPFQKREDSRLVVFRRDEAPLRVVLPPFRFELADLRTAKVQVNYHVQVEKNFYSVPSRLIGHSLDIRVTSHLVEVFDGAERVATHARLTGVQNRYSTVAEHMPEGHRHQLTDWTPQRFEQWAATIGTGCVEAIQAILASRKIVEQSYRSCLGVMSLARKTGGATRLEQSCCRALETTTAPSYTLIRRIWAD